MDTITLGQVATILAWLAGFVGSVGVLYGVINKVVNKKIDEQITDKMEPIREGLEEIKQQNIELKNQGEDNKKEMVLMMKLNQNMISEMTELGHTNGRTAAALQELNDYLINK